MEDNTLFMTALATSILGIILLFFITDEINLQEVGSINHISIDQDITISGKVNRVTQTDKVAFLQIANEKVEQIDVVLFKPEYVMLKEGDYVEIEGSTDEYEGKSQIIGNQVTVR